MSEAFDDLTVNDDGSRSNSEGVIVHQPWMAQNPDTLKINENLAKFKTLGEFSEAHMNLNGELGTLKENTIPKLGDNPTDDEKSAHFTALGRPESADSYTIGKPDNTPESYLYDNGLEKVVRDAGHSAGLSDSALKTVYDAALNHGIEMNKQSLDAVKAEDLKMENALKDEWKGDYTANSEKASRAITKFAGEDGLKFLTDAGIDKHPVLQKIFHKAFEAIGEDFFVTGDKTPPKPEDKRTASGMPVLDFSKSDMPVSQ